ncbi:hypothetical protein V6N13_005018 [Hibiscus sabdariffa]
MKIPPGLQAVGGSKQVCRLYKSLYGLKQSPRAWFEQFTKSSSSGMMRVKSCDSRNFWPPNSKPKTWAFSVPKPAPSLTKTDFQRIVGKFIYLSLTRPDIAFSVNVLSQHMSDPNEEHMAAAYRVLRYLKQTPEHGLLFKKSSDRSIKVFTYSSWAGSLTDRRSTTGYCTFLWGNLVTWRSKKQPVVSRSSAEAEFQALAQGICEGLWLLKVLREVDPNSADYFELLSDNNSAIQIDKNPVQHDRTKHVEIDRHFITEKVQKGTAKLFYIPSDGQLADVLTKALQKPAFDSFKCKLGIYNVYTPA